MLDLRNVYKRFSGIPAIEDVSFAARAGEVTGYLGPNGSGKPTTMKMFGALGVFSISSGEG
jgi:ABC-2 type transport system ATP-binding protein